MKKVQKYSLFLFILLFLWWEEWREFKLFLKKLCLNADMIAVDTNNLYAAKLRYFGGPGIRKVLVLPHMQVSHA